MGQEELKQKIYDILYVKSTVDGVRILHEDMWPIEELVEIAKQYALSVLPKESDLSQIVQDSEGTAKIEHDDVLREEGWNRAIKQARKNIT